MSDSAGLSGRLIDPNEFEPVERVGLINTKREIGSIFAGFNHIICRNLLVTMINNRKQSFEKLQNNFCSLDNDI